MAAAYSRNVIGSDGRISSRKSDYGLSMPQNGAMQANPCRVRRLADFVRRKDERSQVHLDYLGDAVFCVSARNPTGNLAELQESFATLKSSLSRIPVAASRISLSTFRLVRWLRAEERRQSCSRGGSHLTKLAAMDHIDGAESVPVARTRS